MVDRDFNEVRAYTVSHSNPLVNFKHNTTAQLLAKRRLRPSRHDKNWDIRIVARFMKRKWPNLIPVEHGGTYIAEDRF